MYTVIIWSNNFEIAGQIDDINTMEEAEEFCRIYEGHNRSIHDSEMNEICFKSRNPFC